MQKITFFDQVLVIFECFLVVTFVYQFLTKIDCKMPPFWDPFGEVFAQKNGHFCVFMLSWVSDLQKMPGEVPKGCEIGRFGDPEFPIWGPFGTSRATFWSSWVQKVLLWVPNSLWEGQFWVFLWQLYFFAFYTWKCYAEAAAAPAFFRSRSTIATS